MSVDAIRALRSQPNTSFGGSRHIAAARVLLAMFIFGGAYYLWTKPVSIETSRHTHDKAYKLRAANYRPRTSRCTATSPCVFKLVADKDQLSRREVGNNKLEFHSALLTGSMYESENGTYILDWADEGVDIIGKHNEAGRGMELSELQLYNNRLLTFDDRTGLVYEIKKDNTVIPRHVITEGNGETNKGMKIEWSTIKDGNLIVGSFGKEYTSPDGKSIESENNMWVATLDNEGDIAYTNWKNNYSSIRKALNAKFPGYLIHEAVGWSDILQRWVFLPRRVSTEPYDEEKDELRGSNKMVIATEDFKTTEVRDVGVIIPERGFSSFKFVPGTNDRVIAALKSSELAKTGEQRTYITVFNLDGKVLLPETEVPSPMKYEGLEFLSE